MKTTCVRIFTISLVCCFLAHRMKLPILAVAISGTQKALPKHSLNFHGRHDIRIEVLEEIAYDTFAHLSVDDTAEMVRQRIMSHRRDAL